MLESKLSDQLWLSFSLALARPNNTSAHIIPSSRGYWAFSASHAEGAVTAAAAIANIEDLPQQVVETKLTIDGLERERDFYFAKLRDIEVYSSLICLY